MRRFILDLIDALRWAYAMRRRIRRARIETARLHRQIGVAVEARNSQPHPWLDR